MLPQTLASPSPQASQRPPSHALAAPPCAIFFDDKDPKVISDASLAWLAQDSSWSLLPVRVSVKLYLWKRDKEKKLAWALWFKRRVYTLQIRAAVIQLARDFKSFRVISNTPPMNRATTFYLLAPAKRAVKMNSKWLCHSYLVYRGGLF